MLRISLRFPIVAVPLLVGILAAGCTRSSNRGFRTIAQCPGFTLNATLDTIQVTAAGGDFDLGDSTRIIFPAQAINGNARYEVGYSAKVNGQNTAGVNIEPLNNAPTEFDEPITLQISYNKCAQLGSSRLFIVRKESGQAGEKIGGAKSKTKKYVQVNIDHFTEYAIAM
jgi:hypothetical protein